MLDRSPNNNLAFLYPEIANQWHPTKNGDLLPLKLFPKSNKKVWWQCNNAHEWEMAINNRTGQGQGCPYCSGQRVSKENNLEFLFPDLTKEWDFIKNGDLLPSQVTAGSNKKVWWKCKFDHEWQAVIGSRASGRRKCPYCMGNKTTPELTEKECAIKKHWFRLYDAGQAKYVLTMNRGNNEEE